MDTTKIIIGIIALLVLGGGAYALTQSGHDYHADADHDHAADTMPVEADGGIGDGATPLLDTAADTPAEPAAYASQTVIGQSVAGRDIVAHHFGTGANEVLLVTGVHGSDAPNTAALGGELVTYFTDTPTAVPEGLRVTVVPTLNIDGLTDGSRFNGNDVDLNRNFGCEWAPTSMWRDQEVSGGSAPYSEPEATALRNYIEEVNLVGAVVWFAAEGRVYPAACEGTPSADSVGLAAAFATASGYDAAAEFDAYQINGDLTNWLADEGVPAMSVLLSDRSNTEWTKNQAGVDAILARLAN